MKVCRYDKNANPNSCAGCQYGCIERKPAIINEDFEKAVRDMVESSKKEVAMRCKECGHDIDKYEHYVELKDGTSLDESCFFDMAIKKLNAKSKQNGFEEEDDS